MSQIQDSETTDNYARRKKIVDAEGRLSESEKIDLRRRMNVVSAVVVISPQIFVRVDELNNYVKERRDSKSPSWWFWGASAFGLLLHYFLTDNQWVWSFGTTIVVVALAMYGGYLYDTYKADVLLKKEQKEEWDLLFEWIANGGSKDQFWVLKEIMKKNDYCIMDCDEYATWWYEQRADQMANITGDLL